MSSNAFEKFFKRSRRTEVDESEDEKPKKKVFTLSSDGNKELAFNPSNSQFHPIKSATWTKESEGVPFAAFAQTMQCLEQTTKRLEIVQYVTNFYRSIIETIPDELLPTIYLCLNKVAPDYEGIELGIGEGVLVRSIAEVTGRSVNAIKSEMKTKGDLGLVAEASRLTQKVMFAPKPLTVKVVFNKLKEIATMTGKDSVQQKLNCIKSMFVACRGVEARYFIRSLQGTLRVGLAEQSVLVALSHACAQCFQSDTIKHMSSDKRKALLEEYSNIIKEAFAQCSSYDKIIDALISTRDINTLPNVCVLKPGIPIKPMLAHPTKSVDEILRRFENGKFVCEYKYDGERAQIHIISSNEVKIFSRNSENNTTKFPDIVKFVYSAVADKYNFKNAVIDSEIVAYDRTSKQILPFQVLSHRKRKNVDASEITINVCIFAFDLLYLNNVSLTNRGLEVRRMLLQQTFAPVDGQFCFVTDLVLHGDVDQLQEFLDKSVNDGTEGLIVKLMSDDSTYEISKRSLSWLKLKKDYLDNVGDSFDLVVIGGYHGTGKRVGNYGGFLLACYDPDDDEYQSICKIGTGFSDDDLSRFTNIFKSLTCPAKPRNYQSKIEPDIWFQAKEVWEVKCADLSVSPVHFAGMGLVSEDKGISLRFPRFIRRREDKSPSQATDCQQIADMYSNQTKEKQSAKPK